MKCIFYLFFMFLCGLILNVRAQQLPAQSLKRQKIDAKRMDADINSADALPRSREFIRIDSSYYVGWMYEGIYKANHAADFLGYKNAVAPLSKAIKLLSRDYARQLRTRTGDLMKYYPAYRYQLDYSLLAAQLIECYNNINQPQKAFDAAVQAGKWKFQRDYYLSVYANKAWIVHRNRFYTASTYEFLRNSIAENEALANAYLDSGLIRVQKNKRLNSGIFQPGYEEAEKQTIYHYKAILFSYALNIDSAMHYYKLMMNGPLFSYNNYATFLSICGDFRNAAQNYSIASTQDIGDRRLQEWAYYGSILDIYRAQPKRGIQNMLDMIKAAGSTPGFGWYNIALARCALYNGQLMKSDRYINKAEAFKEVHIGTTLGQSHYDFSVNLVKLMNDIGAIQEIKFEHRNWWYNPLLWPEIGQRITEKYLQQYLLVNQLALNPERDKVIYPLFSTESTVSWDEIWFLIRDFSTPYFKRKMEEALKTDKRRLIKKYYSLFVARLAIQEGDYTGARMRLQKILNAQDIDFEYEKLFLARVHEALGICEQKAGNVTLARENAYWMYIYFPQIVPYSEVKPYMHISISGNPDHALISRLRECNINWVSEPASLVPKAFLHFSAAGNKKNVTYYVVDKNGKEIVKREQYTYTRSEQAGIELAYRLFNIEKSGL